MNIKTESINNQCTLYTLSNANGVSVSILDYGGIITRMLTPDRDGKLENIVLGYQNMKDYVANPNYFGAIIGRVAGRIQNARFTLDGKTFDLDKNEGANHLHGGTAGFHQVVWDAKPLQTTTEVGLKLKHQSPDGEGGYPGNVNVTVTYTLNNANQLIIDYEAQSDQTTPLTLTNHSYFNLSGGLRHTVHNHHVTMDSSRFIELDESLIPSGRTLNVADTVFDFRNGRKLADGMEAGNEQNAIVGGGYDHYFVFDQEKRENIIVQEHSSGRVMTIETDQPGVVMYTANGLDAGLALAERPSTKHLGVCFETQAPPASLHHDGFPSIILQAGETYQQQTIFTFSVNR